MRWASGLVVAFLAAGFSSAWAQEAASPPAASAPAGAQPEDPMALQLLDFFSQFCFQKFPDDAALAAEVEAQGAVAMTADEAKERLHGDPGRGWTINHDGGQFVLILESPPYHACAVRAYSDKPLVSKRDMPQMKALAAQDKHLLSKPLLLPNRLEGGVSIMVAYEVTNEDGSVISPKEAYMVVIDSYIAPADPKRKVETRFVRQLTTQ